MKQLHILRCGKGELVGSPSTSTISDIFSENEVSQPALLEKNGAPEDEDELSSIDLPAAYDTTSVLSSHEYSKDPYEVAQGRYRTLADSKLFVEALKNPRSRSTKELFKIAANAQHALKLWQDEYIAIDKRLKIIDTPFLGELKNLEFVPDQKYNSKGNPRKLVDPQIYDLRYEEQLLGLEWNGGDHFDLSDGFLKMPRAPRGAANGWLGSRTIQPILGANDEDEGTGSGRRVTRSNRAKQFYRENSEADTGTSRTPSVAGQRTTRKRNFAETDDTPELSDAPRKRGRPARSLLPPSRLAREVPSGMTTEAASGTATPAPTPSTANSTRKGRVLAKAVTPSTTAPKRKGRPPKALGPQPAKVTKPGSRPKSYKSKNNKELDEHGKQVNRSKAMTDVWAKRKAEGRNGRHGGAPLLRAPRGKPGRPKKDRRIGEEKTIKEEEGERDDEYLLEEEKHGLSDRGVNDVGDGIEDDTPKSGAEAIFDKASYAKASYISATYGPPGIADTSYYASPTNPPPIPGPSYYGAPMPPIQQPVCSPPAILTPAYYGSGIDPAMHNSYTR